MARQLPTDLNTLRTMSMGDLAQLLSDLTTLDAANLYRWLRQSNLAATLPATALPAAVPTPISEWSQHVRSGRAFAARFAVTAVAGQLSQAALWNPTGSGVHLLVYGLRVTSGATNIDILVDELLAEPTTLALLAAAGMRNNLLGGAAPLARVRTGTNATLQQGSGNTQHFAFMPLGSSAGMLADPGEPVGIIFEIGPGAGVVVWENTNQFDLRGTIRWAEVPGS